MVYQPLFTYLMCLKGSIVMTMLLDDALSFDSAVYRGLSTDSHLYRKSNSTSLQHGLDGLYRPFRT